MKRSKPLQRTRLNGGPTLAREPKPWAKPTIKPGRRGTYAGGTTAADPKTVEHRCPALLDMARDRPCMLLIPGICNHRVDTTVACHSNLSIHGKAGNRRADDQYSVWGCAACHYWLDFSKALATQKEEAFMLAHARQVLAWQLLRLDLEEPAVFRRAAGWALKLLDATDLHLNTGYAL
jgi:hypothetical protein